MLHSPKSLLFPSLCTSDSELNLINREFETSWFANQFLKCMATVVTLWVS